MPGEQIRLLHVFSTLAVGGPQRRFAQIANHLDDNVHHTLFATDGRYEALDLLNSSVSYARLEDEIGALGSSRPAIARALTRAAPDKLLTYNWGSIEWALGGKLMRLDRVHHEDGFGPEEEKSQLRRRVWARRLVLKGKTPVILPSRRLETIAREIWKLTPSQLHYLPNGVDLARFTQRRDRQALAGLGLPPAEIYIGTVAALRREKNLARLIEAFNKALGARDARLLIAGEGPQQQPLKEIAAASAAADRIHFIGHLERPEIFLAGLDIFALSSDTEQMPLSVLEAMACGLPVASTNVGDIAHMMSSQTKQFVRGQDADSLAGSLVSLMTQASVRSAVGSNNRARAERNYSLEKMIDQYKELYLN